jgi:hypothetical protein
LSDLPEIKKAGVKVDAASRSLSYSPETKLIVVPEENVLGESKSRNPMVMSEFAKALYHVTCLRPVDPEWNNRGRNVQQYELRVKRLDVQFDEKLQEIFKVAMEKGLWKETPASRDRVQYWAQGVLAYFDAAGEGKSGIPRTREALKDHDPGLYELVHETMAYEDKADWRYVAYQP